MNYTATLTRENRLKELIQAECTGTPKQLAIQLDCSESTVYRLIKALQVVGEPIAYSYTNEDGSKKKGRGWCKAGCWVETAAKVAVAAATVMAVL